MPIRVGINGFGRIGRQVFHVVNAGGFGDLFEIVAINDLTAAPTLAHLLAWDSTYGRFPGTVAVDGDTIRVGDREIQAFAERDPEKIGWDVDLVIESTGRFTEADRAKAHLKGGAKKVIVTAPSKGADATLVIGVNEGTYDAAKHNVISNASCTTNCLAPVAKVLADSFGIERGVMTTVHAYTNDQALLDTPHDDLRRARSAALSIIPTRTGAASAIKLVLPELEGKLDGFALRVPTPTVSLVDLVVTTTQPVTVDAINGAFIAASESDAMTGILGYSREPLVSVDYRQDSRSAIVDGLSTMVMGERMAKVVAWYDNEWAYSCRIVDLVALVCESET